jgi:peptidoglycan L-alanyl-D-glutamate endopeptidase CwlK
MKFHFSPKSDNNLATVIPKLQRVANRALGYGIIDFSVIEGRRTKERQNWYYSTGRSKLKWPSSKHNVLNPCDPARAMDLVPFVNGEPSWNYYHCCVLAGVVLAAAKEEGVKIRWGGNWNMDGEPITDQSFQDLTHYEEEP